MTDVPVNDVLPLVTVSASGGQTIFSYPFLIQETSQLAVQRTQDPSGTPAVTTLTLNVDYSVQGTGSATGGTITLLPANFPSGATAGDQFTLFRDIPIERLTDFPFRGNFSASAINLELDRLTLVVQEIARDVLRSVALPINDPLSSMVLPLQALRANKAFHFDSAGAPQMVEPTDASGTSVTASGSTTSRSLAERFAEVFNVKDYGATGDGVSSDQVGFDAAAAALNAAGGGVFYMPAPSVKYVLTAGVDITVPCHILGAGMDVVTIDQQTMGGDGVYGLPIFEIRGADGVTVEGFTGTTSSTRAKIENIASYDGEPPRGRSSVVYIANCNQVLVKNIRALDFNNGIYFRGVTTDTTSRNTDIIAHDCIFDTCDQGILAQQIQRVIWSNIIGTNISTVQAVGSHTVYHSGGNSTAPSQDITISNVVENGNTDDAAVKLVDINGLNLSGFVCEGNPRGLDISEVRQFTISNLNMTDLSENTSDSLQAGLNILDCDQGIVSNIKIRIEPGVDNVRCISVRSEGGTATQDIVIDGAHVSFGYTAANTVYPIWLRGAFSTQESIYFKNVYGRSFDDGSAALFRIEEGTNIKIDRPSLRGQTRLLDVTSGANSGHITVDRELLSSGVDANTILDPTSRFTVLIESVDEEAFADADATPSVMAGKSFRTSNTGPTSITDFDDGFDGQEIIIRGNDANTTIADGASLRLNANANFVMTQNDIIALINNGGIWLEQYRSVN